MITSGFRFSIKVTGELTDPEQFNDLVVRSMNDKMIRIGTLPRFRLPIRGTGSPFHAPMASRRLPLTVAKRTGEDIVRIVDEAKKILEEEKALLAGRHALRNYLRHVEEHPADGG